MANQLISLSDHPGDIASFRQYLKRRGKKEHVIAGLVRQVEHFEQFLADQRQTQLEAATSQDLLENIAKLKASQPNSSRTEIRALVLYYRFVGKDELADLASAQREARIAQIRSSLPLRDFLNVDLPAIQQLAALGIHNADQMLAAGATQAQRTALAQTTGLPEALIYELVKLSDLARIPGVKAIRSRLYYDAGVDSVEKMAELEPEALLALTAEFVRRTNFDGIPPLPKEVQSTISTARSLPKIIEQ